MLSNTEFVLGSALVLFLLVLLVRNIIKVQRSKLQLEGLCMRPSGSCRDYSLIDALGQPYSPPNGHGIEPNDISRYMTSSMVIPELLPEDHENAKKKFLTNANLVYLDYENDRLNKELLPSGGLLFTSP